MQEHIVETKQCKSCSVTFQITAKDLEFYDKISPVFNEKKYLIPSPKLCPDCRQQRRLTRRNENSLYRRKCDFSKKDIISIYSPNIISNDGKIYKVYDQSIWWSDSWDPLDYSVDFDFKQSFFLKFRELLKDVPMQSLYVTNSTNSEFCNHTGNCKNAYMNIASRENEDTYYLNRSLHCKKSCDCLMCDDLKNSYQCVDCSDGYKLFFSQNTSRSNNSMFLYSCEGCDFCFMCSNQKNKSYYIRNKQYKKNEYFDELQKLIKMDIVLLQLEFSKMKLQSIHKFANIINSQNSTGDSISDSKNCFYCFNVYGNQDCKYIENSVKGWDLQDGLGVGENHQLGYEMIDSGQNQTQTLFVFVSRNCSNIYYCFNCHNCNYCFGCVGLRNKQYCILNKQHTKEEYEKLVPKIIEKMMFDGERGEFFPASLSPFGYNETVAMEYFPLTKEEALAKGFNRSDYEAPFPQVDKILKANELLDIQDVTDDILQKAIECEVTKKPFRIIKPELEFYRKHNLTIPTKHPDQRHKERMALRNPRKLRDRNCMKCGIDLKTSYSPDRKEIVYCEVCYNKEIY